LDDQQRQGVPGVVDIVDLVKNHYDQKIEEEEIKEKKIVRARLRVFL
jgi:hypothetical protein